MTQPQPPRQLTLGQWNPLQPVADHLQGEVITSGIQAIPAIISDAKLRADTPMAGVAFPFNDPAMVLTLELSASWDGGTTMIVIYRQTANGSPTGLWGKGAGLAWPQWGMGVPRSAQGVRADHFEANLTVTAGGPISFGLSLLPT
jgi:hypothetical protein